MFRLFDMLGRSGAMRALDDALRASGVHPVLVPDPVKLTVIQLCRKQPVDQAVAFAQAADMLVYCLLSHAQFAANSSSEDAMHLDNRLENALEDGDSFDAKLVLLALHSGLIAPEIADRIDLDDL